MIKSVFQIDAPRERLFGILTDFPRYREWMPGCKESKVVSQSDNSAQVELTLASVKTINMGLEFDLTPTQLISFRKYSGKDIKEYLGSWRLMNASDGAGTVVVGEMEMDAGAMVPKFMVSRMVERSISQTAEALKKRIATAPATPKYEVAEVAAVEAGVEAGPPVHRRKRVIHVLRMGEGYRIWIMGKTHFYKVR
ncbi:MAG: SRPBCC family protein [Bryobacteraceae bacterium]